MKRFVLPRKLFTKAEKYDFIDDGNTFNVFLYKGIVPIDKCCVDGRVYLSIELYQVFDTRTQYDVYSIIHREFELGVSYGYAKEHFDEFIHDCEIVYNMIVPSEGRD